MKKNLVILLVALSLVLFACSEGGSTGNSGQASALDLSDLDAIYDELKDSSLKKYNREDMDFWQASYMDITGDGNDDIAFVAPYGEGALEEVIFISGDDGSYALIPSDIELYKYENQVELVDGLIAVTRTGGGSGVRFTTMSIYDYDGIEIVDTETSIVMEDIVSSPNGYEITGSIEGQLTDFTHTLVRHDLATEKTLIVEETRYEYDADDLRFLEIDKEMILSASMTKEDILIIFGNEYDESEEYNDMDGSTIITMIYPGIEFSFSHYSKEIPLDLLPNEILVTSNEYRYQYDVSIGETALEAISKCEKKFDKMINPHGGPDEEIVDWFIYKEKNAQGQTIDNGYILSFDYNTGARYFDIEEFTDHVLVTGIKLFNQYN